MNRYQRRLAAKKSNTPQDAARALTAGFAHHQAGRLPEAGAEYRKSLEQQPDNHETLHLFGVLCDQMGRHDKAAELIAMAIRRDASRPAYHSNLANALRALGRYNEALASHDKAIALDANFADAWSNRGIVLRDLDRLDESLVSFDRALAIAAGHADAWSNRGITLADLGRAAAAVASFDRAIALNPRHRDAHYNRAQGLMRLRRFEDAIDACDRALAIDPAHIASEFNKALIHLLLGRFDTGLPEYEKRWTLQQLTPPPGRFAQPIWLGEQDIAGQTILLHAEQGLGDTLQFCRYAILVKQRGATVIIEAPRPLVPLLAGMTAVSQVIETGKDLPPFDFHCPLASLPLACGTTMQTIPSLVPYVHPDPSRLPWWRNRLPALGRPRVGLVWSGNQHLKKHLGRSIAFQDLAPLLACDVTMLSVQAEIQDSDLPALRAQPSMLLMGREFVDFADTAAVLSELDLIITIDTSVAHLAGAMGRPVWIMLPFVPDWRWFLDREDSPWYPTARLFRQDAPNDWSGPIARVAAALQTFK